ncbi:L-seryl-tRNA(Sec) selenium transferase [Fusobacterium sp. MFO224]|uniref:L-seryl-tRNA(Sec) selenium transferase n=1 Tax=Fusobacterium sp. MFO224 TaxID=3378070 RepID=UPI003854C57A
MNRDLLKKLPKVDYIKNIDLLIASKKGLSEYTFLQCIKESIEKFRKNILNEKISDFNESQIIEDIKIRLEENKTKKICKVINGTGTIIHTNLGRSIYSKEIGNIIYDVLTSYNNLEYDIAKGDRGSRYSNLEKLIIKVTGAEGALVVNNNAAAVLLCLNEFANKKEVIVSRGELVEIGGSFRIPKIMEFSGAKLVEVGSTNKTYIGDYLEKINENTRVLMKVHTSNYKIQGFTYEATNGEIAILAKEKDLISMEDLGSGNFINFSKYGVTKEPTVYQSIESGMDLITFSGDKLFGGCQAGIILGKKEYIDRLKKNQYLRTIRVDKLTIGILESVFEIYLNEKEAIKKIPTLRMITEKKEEVLSRAKVMSKLLSSYNIEHKIIETKGNIGGGSMPQEEIDSFGIEFYGAKANFLEKAFRENRLSIIGIIRNNKFILDLKTIQEEDIEYICKNIFEIYKREGLI